MKMVAHITDNWGIFAVEKQVKTDKDEIKNQHHGHSHVSLLL